MLDERIKAGRKTVVAWCAYSAELEPYLDLSSLWFAQQSNSTSNVNPHFCAVLLCRPWQGPAQGGDSGLLRLPLN